MVDTQKTRKLHFPTNFTVFKRHKRFKKFLNAREIFKVWTNINLIMIFYKYRQSSIFSTITKSLF